MEKQAALEKLQAAKDASPQRNFTQSVDLIINLKDLDLNSESVDFYVTLHNGYGKDVKICGLVGPELQDEAEEHCDHVIPASKFDSLDKDEIKEVAKTYDYFVAQANVMPQVATTFGRYLGPRGKMPNPQAGCVVPPKASLEPLMERLQRTVHVTAKDDPVIHLLVGSQDQDEDEVAGNIAQIYDQISMNLPLEENNIKNALVKLTMGKPVEL